MKVYTKWITCIDYTLRIGYTKNVINQDYQKSNHKYMFNKVISLIIELASVVMFLGSMYILLIAYA